MGSAAAEEVARRIVAYGGSQEEVRIVFAAAPSQNEFLDCLASASGVPWDRVVAFHMDEYIGLAPGAGESFGNFLRERLFGRVPLKAVHYIDPGADDPEQECARYARILREAPLDVACLGIGENGHLAFNDPPVADFEDSELVKVVALDAVSREQQVHDGCFPDIRVVPLHAITLTIPALMQARYCSVVVPGPTKARAVAEMLDGPVAPSCPASVLRRHLDADLNLDSSAAAHVDPVPHDS